VSYGNGCWNIGVADEDPFLPLFSGMRVVDTLGLASFFLLGESWNGAELWFDVP